MNPDEKRIAAKQCLEAKYTRVNKLKEDREMRKQNLRAKMDQMQLIRRSSRRRRRCTIETRPST